jgi:hypothetical protein
MHILWRDHRKTEERKMREKLILLAMRINISSWSGQSVGLILLRARLNSSQISRGPSDKINGTLTSLFSPNNFPWDPDTQVKACVLGGADFWIFRIFNQRQPAADVKCYSKTKVEKAFFFISCLPLRK